MHAAGHNTSPINRHEYTPTNADPYSTVVYKGHTDDGVMADGNWLIKQIQKGGIPMVLDMNKEDNKFYVRSIIQRYGKQKAKDNYDKNKQAEKKDTTREPAYNLE